MLPVDLCKVKSAPTVAGISAHLTWIEDFASPSSCRAHSLILVPSANIDAFRLRRLWLWKELGLSARDCVLR
jgi:hypothetical protein